MNRGFKSIIALLLAIVLSVGALSVAALAAGEAEISEDAVTLNRSASVGDIKTTVLWIAFAAVSFAGVALIMAPSKKEN